MNFKLPVTNKKRTMIIIAVIIFIIIFCLCIFFFSKNQTVTKKAESQTVVANQQSDDSKQEQDTATIKSDNNSSQNQESSNDSASKTKETNKDTQTKTSKKNSQTQSTSKSSQKTTTNKSSSTNQSSSSTHEHVWKDHKSKRWVSKMVTVTDYETQTIRGAKFYTYNGTNELGQPTYIANGPTYWFEDGFTQDDLKNIISEGMKNADENRLYNGVYYGNYQNVTKTEKVEVGSHQEDQGYYEEYIDYQYCSICGAKK